MRHYICQSLRKTACSAIQKEAFHPIQTWQPTDSETLTHMLETINRRRDVKVKVQAMRLRRLLGELLKPFMVHQTDHGKWAQQEKRYLCGECKHLNVQ